MAQIREVTDEWFPLLIKEQTGVEDGRWRKEIREEEGDEGEIRGDKFRNERYRCKKPNLVSPKEWMPMKDAGTQLA